MYLNPSTNITHLKFPYNHERSLDLVIDDEQYHLHPLKQFLWEKLNETLLNTTTTIHPLSSVSSSHRFILLLTLFISLMIILIGASVAGGYYIWKRKHALSNTNKGSFSFPMESSLSSKDYYRSTTVPNEDKKGTALVSELFPYLV